MVRCLICNKGLRTASGYYKHIEKYRLNKSLMDFDKKLKKLYKSIKKNNEEMANIKTKLNKRLMKSHKRK